MAKKKQVPPAVLKIAEEALSLVTRALADAGLDKLPAAVKSGPLLLTNAPAKKPKPCAGCPPGLPEEVLKMPPGAQRVYVAILVATEADAFLGTKEIVKRTKISPRSVGRHLELLRGADLIHFVAGKGHRRGGAPNLFSATS